LKLVVLTSRFPWPIEKGDKLRIYHQLKHLSAHYDILLICVTDEKPTQQDLVALDPFCSEIKSFSIPKWHRYASALYHWIKGQPAQVGYFFSSRVKKEIYKSIIAFEPDRIYCQLIRVSEYVKTLPFVKVLDYMDTFSSGMRRQAEVRSFPSNLFYRREATLTRNYERQVYSYFDETTIISERDKQELPMLSKNLVKVIPNGIDSEYFIPIDDSPSYDLAFVGNLGYKPNEEAVLNLLTWYKAANFDRPVRVLIAGARPTDAVLSIDEKHWTIAGWVDDIRTAYRDAKIFVAPLTIGSGLQNKILEAMSCGLPCVTTEMVNVSIGAADHNEIVIADTPEKWKIAILDLLDSPEKRMEIGENARNFVLNNYQWYKFNSSLNDLIKHAKSKSNFGG